MESIIIVVMLAVFLEMLLPAGEMRKYTKMIMGLMIIVAVIQAFNGITGGGLFKEVEGYTLRTGTDEGQTMDILKKGKSLDAENKKKAMAQYQAGLERQVEGLAGIDGKLKMSGAEVKLQDNPDSKDYGKIMEIDIVVSKNSHDSGQLVEPVKTVKVIAGGAEQDENRPSPAYAEAAKNAAARVANFYNLSPGQVKVIFK